MSVLIFLDLPGRNIRFLPVNHRRNLRSSHAAVGVTLEHIQASSTLLIPLLMWKAQKSIHSACTDTVPTNPALINISSVTLGEIFQLSSKLLFIISIKNRLGGPLPMSRNVLLSLLTKKVQQSIYAVPFQKGEGSSSGSTDLGDALFQG